MEISSCFSDFQGVEDKVGIPMIICVTSELRQLIE